MKNQKITVTVDKHGSVELHGLLHGDHDAPRVAEALGLASYYQLGIMHTGMRADGLDQSTLQAVADKARERGYKVSEVDKLPSPNAKSASTPTAEDHHSTTEILHAHSLGPSAKEKAVIPVVLLVGALALFGVGMVVMDHMKHDYKPTGSLEQLASVRSQIATDQGALQNLINPDDSPFARVEVRGWNYWRGKGAITQNCYVRMPDLPVESIEALVTGDRGAATLIFMFDTRGEQGSEYRIDSINRGGMDIEMSGFGMEVYPLSVSGAPALTDRIGGSGYLEHADIAYDRDNTLARLARLAIRGYVQKTEDGFRIVTDDFNVALSGAKSTGIERILSDHAVTDDDLVLAVEKSERGLAVRNRQLTLFVTLAEIFSWKDGNQPGRRQTTREIGLAELDGIRLGKIFVKNQEPGAPSA